MIKRVVIVEDETAAAVNLRSMLNNILPEMEVVSVLESVEETVEVFSGDVAADVVFMTSCVDAIPESLAIAKQTNAIAWQNVIFALAIKFAVMILGLLGFASMWLAVFADSGVAMLCVLNSIRILYKK